MKVTNDEQRADAALDRLPRGANRTERRLPEYVAPGETFSFSFTANDPGIYMYHCGTKPVLAHIANGMYGAIIVEPKAGLPPVDRQYVLVSSEWYLSSPGLDTPAALDMTKARQMTPDWVTWNGYAGQYVKHPLTADPGDTVRFWVLAAGPSLNTDFHVVGTILNRAWVNQDMTSYQQGVQTVLVPAGGGAVFDVQIDDEGLYPFVSHSFASVDMGLVGSAEGRQPARDDEPLSRTLSPRKTRSRGPRRGSESFLGSLRLRVAARDLVPVDDVPPRGEVVGSAVLVVEVVRVLPDVDAEQRHVALHERRVLVRRRVRLQARSRPRRATSSPSRTA